LVGKKISAEEIGKQALFPSVICALQSALLDLSFPETSSQCCVQALLINGDLFKKAAKAKDKGFTVAKLKVGTLSLEETQGLIERLQDDFRLRLDFNQKWKLAEVQKLAEWVDWSRVDYFEEPTVELDGLDCSLALDESLLQKPLEALPKEARLVIKPTLLGDIVPFVKSGRSLVLSSCFEGKIGVRCLARLANRLGIGDQPQGLDTLK